MSAITITAATPDQRGDCYALAYEIYCDEMGTLRYVADHQQRILIDDAIRKAHLLRAESDGILVGTLGLLTGDDAPFPGDLEQIFQIERFLHVLPRTKMALNIRFAVRQEFRSSLVPFRLIVESGRHHVANGIQLVFCDCQPHLVNLYENLGLRPLRPGRG